MMRVKFYTLFVRELRHAFEGEMSAQIHGTIRKCGKYINTCLAPYIGKGVPKFGWGSDSSVTIYRIPKLTLPELKMDYLSAKIQRFIGWSEEATMTRFWPMCRLHTPDRVNNLADAAARIAGLLSKRYPGLVEVDAEEVDRTMSPEDFTLYGLPIAIHSYHTEPPANAVSLPRVPGMPLELPQGTAAYTMMMTDAQWTVLEEAYRNDDSDHCGVRMSEVYMALHCKRAGLNTIT